MRKTGMGRELRKESIACRPCSLNFDDKLLREVPDFCAAQCFTVVNSILPFIMRPAVTFSNF